MKRYLTGRNFLFLILISAFILRFWNAGNQDIFGDEAAYAFRSIGYLDYLGTNFQTQPIDWYKNQSLPSWTSLSFHDHPPLGFLIQNIFFKVFGDTVLASRLPAITLGTASIYLIYLIVNSILGADLALFSALIFSISGAAVWIFRTSLLEPALIFLILLNIYYFFKFLENKKFWFLWGATFGLILLVKYTGIFLLPVYLSYLFLFYKKFLKDKFLYFGLLTSLVLFIPVIIYNIFLYKSTGHFDLQFSYLLGQNTPEWSGLIGKTQAPFAQIIKNLKDLYGINFFSGLSLGIIFLFFNFKIQNTQNKRFFNFLFLYILFVTLLLVKIGSANRFLILYIPALIIIFALAIDWLWNYKSDNKLKHLFKFIAAGLIFAEAMFSLNKNFFINPDYGIAKLDHYFEQEFFGKRSAVIPESDNPHLNQTIREFAKKNRDGNPEFLMIVYNDNLALPTLEWIFYRRFFYHNMPALFIENFNKAVVLQGEDYFKEFEIYFVQSVENTLLNPFKSGKTAALELENKLLNNGLRPDKIIYGKDNLPMFKIYKFNLRDYNII